LLTADRLDVLVVGIYGRSVAKPMTPTAQDRVEVTRLVLSGLAGADPLDDAFRSMRPFLDFEFPFPGDVLTEVCATALEIAGATRATPLSLTDATEQHLREWPISGNTAHQKYRAAVQAAIAPHAGIDVDYYEVAGWWNVQDYTRHAFAAAVVLIRVAADRTGRSVASICNDVAARLGTTLEIQSR
jgi:hypothetical protein